ncbi:hypothetical protein Micbo1qcDRAFT_56514 [Microdochium bolleyi]|uniref:Uncharacterized protein n=1 Tax=Microdochium bolleyi TaxID=196109 RepID=A0A136IJT3_9PEZI|nr:hypothetical protein Micbo1qcDRAFT_56514 [Microdochium bolleyi]
MWFQYCYAVRYDNRIVIVTMALVAHLIMIWTMAFGHGFILRSCDGDGDGTVPWTI